MDRTPVQSTMFKSLGHEGDVLEMEFSSGRIGRHAGVTPNRFAALLAADSIGQHYNQHFKGKFDFLPVEPEPERVTSWGPLRPADGEAEQ